MSWRVRKPFRVFARGVSLRRRVAYSLAIVRLILVPVIFLAVYYLFRMGWIVDRIVSVDAPVATLAERVSTNMLDARRAERNYFLLHDPKDLETNHEAVAQVAQLVDTISQLQPSEKPVTDKMKQEINLYQARLQEAVQRLGQPSEGPKGRLSEVVQAYENNLNQVLRRSGNKTRAQLLQELQDQLDSLDDQITTTMVAEDPRLFAITKDLQNASDLILKQAPALENRGWSRVMYDHDQARGLVRRAEWVGGSISLLVLLLSVWVSFILPREAVRPLSDLKDMVDRAASGDYEVEFDVQGEGEVVQLAHSIRRLVHHVREVLESEVAGMRR